MINPTMSGVPLRSEGDLHANVSRNKSNSQHSSLAVCLTLWPHFRLRACMPKCYNIYGRYACSLTRLASYMCMYSYIRRVNGSRTSERLHNQHGISTGSARDSSKLVQSVAWYSFDSHIFGCAGVQRWLKPMFKTNENVQNPRGPTYLRRTAFLGGTLSTHQF